MLRDIFIFSRYDIKNNLGGIESVARLQINAFKSVGYRVSHVSNTKVPKIPYYFFNKFFQPFSLSVFKHLIKCLKTESTVIIHYPEFFYPLAFWMTKVKANVFVIHHADVIFSFPFFKNCLGLGNFLGKVVTFFHRPMYHKASIVFFTSNTYWQHSFARHYCSTARVKILCPSSSLENDTDPLIFKPIIYSNRDVLKLLVIGRMVKYKGLFLLLKAFANLNEYYELTIVGDGHLRCDLEKYWEKVKKKKRSKAKVIFVGVLTNSEIKKKFIDSHGLVLASLTRQEAFGVVLVEALSMGRPIISPIITGSGVTEINPEGMYGGEFEAGMETSLIKTIKNFRERLHTEGKKLSRDCFEIYNEQYKRKNYINEFLNVISSHSSLKRKVYLHLGYPKTATTTLRNKLFPHFPNIFYLGKRIGKYKQEWLCDGIPSSLLYDLYSNNSTFHKRANEYNLMLKGLPHDSLMFSDENMMQLHFPEITIKQIASNIKKLFSGYNINLLITVRRQSDLIESVYNQSYMLTWRKHPELNTLDLFVDNLLASNIKQSKYNFKYAVDDYVDNFSRRQVGIFVYEELENHPDNFLNSLKEFLQIKTLSLPEPLSKLNTRFNNRQYHNYTLWNFFSDWKKRLIHRRLLPIGLNQYLSYLLKQVSLYNVSQHQFYLTDEQRKSIDDKFRDSNQKLSNDFGLNLQQYGYF